MTSHEPRSVPYKRAFVATALVAVVLAAIAVALAWRLRQQAPATSRQAHTTHTAHLPAGAGATAPDTRTAPALTGESPPPLAPIQLSPQRMQSIGVQIARVERKRVDDDLRLYGNVQVDERRVAAVQSRVAGWIREVYANATGDLVRKGQPLFTIYSPDLVTTEREYLLARKNAKDLAHSPVAGVASGASALLLAARDRLLQWDVSPAEMTRVEQTGEVTNAIAIDSPATGYVTEKNALPNLYVHPDTRLYTVTDLSQVWVLAQVFQNDAGRIRRGATAHVTVDAYPGVTFNGRVDEVLPQVDVATRTLPVRLVFSNPGLKLRPGMYVDVRLEVPLGWQLVVPASAVFHAGTRNLVFAYADDGRVTPRVVEIGPRVADQQVLLTGVQANDTIVTSAAFLIDSEAQLQAAAGAFVPPPPGAGAASAMNRPAQPHATLAMTTDPTPPRKGRNTVRVTVTGPDGRGVSGARVTVTFFMAAMPAMGMAAMKTVVDTTDKGGGLYEGAGVLRAGGTWQVTVVATQKGHTIATRQLSVTATGGM
ncbi:MAG TPA: efflux RND transporter periplasmic adaptor subunit [Vicinamibacterales bacterium]|nr:efflux RND transporter periplasmic adaptor subunit [Vicinamibacterales bacterium]